MATKKFIIEVEEGETECLECPFAIRTLGGSTVDCFMGCKDVGCEKYNLATMKILELEEENNDSRTTD